MSQFKSKRVAARWGITFAASLIIAILVEICGFNYQSLETRLFPVGDISIDNQQSTSFTLDFSDTDTIDIPITGSVASLSFAATTQSTAHLSIFATDEGNQIPYELGQIAVPGTKAIRINPSGNLTSLRVTSIGDNRPESTIDLQVNTPIPFSIEKKRILALTAVIFAGFAVSISSPLARKRYDSEKLFPLAIGAISALGLFLFCMVSAVPADTPGYEHHHQYYELAQALAFGQTSLLAKPSPELLALDNPYDTTARISSGAAYLWDHAYFNGRYYVYFGVLPAIIYYLPFYLITSGGELPNWIAVGISYALFSTGLVFLLFNICKKWFHEASQASFLLCFVTLMLGSWALPGAQSPDLYNVPISLGLACSAWGLAFLVKAVTPCKVNLWSACLGVALLSLTILCRPQMLLFGVVAITLAIFALRNSEERRSNTRTIFIAVIPIAIIGLAAGIYNYSRFGSPFDFGANYNLTTNDMTHRGWNIERLPLALFAYLIEPFSFSLSTMTFAPVNLDCSYYGITISQTMHGGMLALIPILPCAILAFLLKPHMDKWREPLYLVCILISCCVVIVAFDANGAGILMRYFADFGLLCSLAACLSMMALLNEYDSRNTQQIETTAASGAQVLLSKSLILTGLISLVLQLIELGIFST